MLCLALIFSGNPLAFSGKKGGQVSTAKRTQGPPSPNLPNLDQARKLKPVPPKARTPIPSTKCPYYDKVCKQTKEKKAGNQSPSSSDGFNRLLASADNQPWFSRFDFKKADWLGLRPLADDAQHSVSDVPMGVSPRTGNRFSQPLEAEPAMMFFTGPTTSDLDIARLDPKNRIGTPGEDLFSGNFNWSLPVFGRSGRAGLDFGLALSYNSLVWIKSGSWMTFDPDHGFPGPGFRLGFPVIESALYTPQAGGNAYLMIMPSGQHVEFRQISGTSVYEAADSSYLQLTVESTTNTMTVRTTDGTQIKFDWHSYSQRYLCSTIKDRNGNYLSVSYTSFDGISSVTDTLGRQFLFVYDTYNNLTSINYPTTASADAWVTFGYSNLTIQTSFTNLSVDGPANSTSINVLTQVSLRDGSYCTFAYNTWGQVTTINRYADTLQRAYTTYNLPGDASSGKTDCPRFTQRTDWAYEWNTGVQFSYHISDSSDVWGTVTTPDGTVYKEHFYTSGWQTGLSDETQVWASSVKKKWTTVTWTQDNTSVSYPLNPRVTETNIYDDVDGNGTADNRRRTTISYTSVSLPSGATCNLPYDATEYAADASTVLRTSRATYNTDSTYLNPHIIGLPSLQYLYQGTPSSGTLASKVEYLYDSSGSISSLSPAPTQHDETYYSSSVVAGRGNLTRVRRYDVTGQATTYLESQIGYNTTGAVTSQREPDPSSGVTHQTSISYTDSFSDVSNTHTYAYPTSLTDADSKTSTVQYSYALGAVTLTQDPKGAGVARTYDSAGRPDHVTNQVSGAYTRYVYASNQYYMQSYSTIKDASTEYYTITVFDGAGRVRAVAADHPKGKDSQGNEIAGYRAMYNAYDVMGQRAQWSPQTEINGYWTPDGDDAAGWLWNYQDYDWKGRPTVFKHTDDTTQNPMRQQLSYSGCGCAGGEVTTMTDEVGRQQKTYHDVLGRVSKTEVLNTNQTVYSTTTNTYNVRDQITQIVQQVGSSGTSQTTMLDYDGHGRLATKQLPIFLGNPQSATHAFLSYEYFGDDTLKKVTDPRGAASNYSYNGRHLTTAINYDVTSEVAATPNVSYTYDDAGHRATMTDGAGSTAYTYNDQGTQLLSETRTITGLSGSFTLSYTYNISGELASITDPFGVAISYDYDRAGRLEAVRGTGTLYGGVSQYTSTTPTSVITYRAWDGLKHMTYGNNVALNLTYDVRQQMMQFQFTGGKSQGSNQTIPVGSNYQYFTDGRVKFASDMLSLQYDRSYSYDQAGRLAAALTGAEARNDTGDLGPYRYDHSYDVWNNLTSRGGRFWSNDAAGGGTSYQNDRDTNTTLVYDTAGNITRDLNTQNVQRNHSYDANGAQTYVSDSNITISQSYDCNGQAAKRVETHVTPAYNQTTYYLRSSVLGGQVVTELDQGGVKQKGYVYAGGQVIAKQSGGQVSWQHRAPVTGDLLESSASGFYTSQIALDELGGEVGFTDPYLQYANPDYASVKGSAPLYEDGGDPFDLSGGCTLDGVPVSCSFAMNATKSGAASVKWISPFLTVNGGSIGGTTIFIDKWVDIDTGDPTDIRAENRGYFVFIPNQVGAGVGLGMGFGFQAQQKPQNPTPTPTPRREGPCAGVKVADLDYSKVRDYYKGSHLVTESARDHILKNHIDGLPGKSRYETDPPQDREAMFVQVQFYNASTFSLGIQINTVNKKGDLAGITFVFQFPPIVPHPYYETRGAGWIGRDQNGNTTLLNTLHLDPDCKTVRNSYPGTP